MPKNIKYLIYKILSLTLIFVVLCGGFAYAQPSDPSAKSAILVEYETGQVLYRFNDNEKLPIASVTKIMTLCLIFDAIDAKELSYEDIVTVGANAANMGGSQVFLENGGKYKAEDLIKSIIIASANDACVAMAEHLEGNQQNFVIKMNKKAKELGMVNTNFINCTGMPADEHYSTAYDVGLMSREVLKHEDFYKYSTIWMDKIEHSQGRITELTNTNKLIRFYEGCDGVKTGYTDEAGHCVSATVEKDGMRLISVIIGGKTSQKRFDDARSLINFGFESYKLKNLLEDIHVPQTLALEGGVANEVAIKPVGEANIVFNKADEEKILCEINLPSSIKAPINKGDKVGEIIFKQDGRIISQLDVIATQDCKKATISEFFDKIIDRW